ncbi:disease resistance protein Pik-2-like [Miscanthus floridulus]|uniref:disease resistance protein Pik-2-like n=1 Tax=Miscanthus floridulus TaxID=154761 RepID=UPI0034581422
MPMVNDHSMWTRRKSSFIQPVDRLNLHTALLSPLPKTFRSALADPNWRAAMQAEFDALLANDTWTLVACPPGVNVVTGKWVYHHKFLADGSLDRYKASTPIDTHTKISADGVLVADLTHFHSIAGALQYLTFTHLDLAYAVQQVYLYMHDPREPHLAAMKAHSALHLGYLVVIDDVWSVRAREAIQSKLPESKKGSRIMVTTRIEIVANACSPNSSSGLCIHKMEPLKVEDSKKLFVSRVFGSMDAVYPKQFEDVMGDILKKCGGLPLAIVSIASVLVGYKSLGSKDKWDRVCKSIGSHMENHPTLEGMKHIVILSYNHLPHELKGCMMYFSIFLEDYVIRKERLLNRWMAEGLIHLKRGLTMWEVAESYLDELLSRNMIEEAGHFGGYA